MDSESWMGKAIELARENVRAGREGAVCGDHRQGLYWARPAGLYYASTRGDAAGIGFDDAYIYEQLETPVEARAIPMTQLMREEALAAFAEWERKADKVRY